MRATHRVVELRVDLLWLLGGGGRQGKLHDRFTHHDKHHIERPLAQGVVMERKNTEALEGIRLPAAFYMYDTSAL